MSDEKKVPPALPGANWQGEVLFPASGTATCAVALRRAYVWDANAWRQLSEPHVIAWVFVAWAEHMAKVAAAERALREALLAATGVDVVDVDDSDGGPVDVAARALRALGVDP